MRPRDELPSLAQRARALAIVVASPRLLRAVPSTPDQLRMANGLCAFVEFARPIAAPTDTTPTETQSGDEKSPVQLVMQPG